MKPGLIVGGILAAGAVIYLLRSQAAQQIAQGGNQAAGPRLPSLPALPALPTLPPISGAAPNMPTMPTMPRMPAMPPMPAWGV